MSVHRWRSIVTGLATIATIAVGAGITAGAAGASRPVPARMLVYAQEWSLWPSRTSLPAGQVIVQLWNRGQDAHDLRIRRLDHHGRMVGRTWGMTLTQSGKLSEASWRLGAGRYELYCSMAGHVRLGMHARLRVR